MSLYIETIKLLDGELTNLQFHQRRFEETRSRALGLSTHPTLEQVIQVPDGMRNGLLKCRVVYGKEIIRIEFQPQEKRLVQSLKMVHSDTISYEYKMSDRSALNELYNLRGSCDDILIIKNGCVTDSSFANVVFLNDGRWFTPDTPLLPGTMRASLLARGDLDIMRITPDDLGKFQKARLINAMNNLFEGNEIPIEAIMY